MRSPTLKGDNKLADAPTEWQGRIDDLLRIRSFCENWDGEGAARPVPEVVDAALDWLQRMQSIDATAIPPTSVASSPGGEILFVWQNENGYLEAEIVSPDLVEWMRSAPGDATRHWETALDQVVRPG